jgi:hypothetical protein
LAEAALVRLFVDLGREGVVTVIAASKEFKILSQNTLDGSLMASPIADGSALFLRTDKALYKIGK